MMKKLLVWSLVLVALLLAVYRITNRAPSASLAQTERVLKILEDGGCLSCHSAEPKLPFYASFPVVGDVVVTDSKEGYKMFDCQPLIDALKSGQTPSMVDVAKVEKAAIDGDMPMAKYYLVHWGSQMTDAKCDIIVDWAQQCRAAYYNDGLEGEFAGSVIRPVAQSLEVDPAKVELGRILYHDTRLSVDNTVSCASCHGLNTGGVDNKQSMANLVASMHRQYITLSITSCSSGMAVLLPLSCRLQVLHSTL